MFEECRAEGDFVLSSGRKSNFFYDFDLLQPDKTAEYIQLLVNKIPKQIKCQADFIAAPALGV